MPPSVISAALYGMFLISGVCGLGYQMVWSRMFAIGLGHEMPSLLAVVVAFFAGLSIGAWTLDAPVSRSHRPGCWYGSLELIIGLWGIVLAEFFPGISDLAVKAVGLDVSPLRHWTVAFMILFVF